MTRTLDDRAESLRRAGFDPVLVRPDGCPRKAQPHACANCAVGVVKVARP